MNHIRILLVTLIFSIHLTSFTMQEEQPPLAIISWLTSYRDNSIVLGFGAGTFGIAYVIIRGSGSLPNSYFVYFLSMAASGLITDRVIWAIEKCRNR